MLAKILCQSHPVRLQQLPRGGLRRSTHCVLRGIHPKWRGTAHQLRQLPLLASELRSGGHSSGTQGSAPLIGRRTALLSTLGPCCCCAACGPGRRLGWYDKYFAYAMAVGMEDYEQKILPMKQKLLSGLSPKAGITDVLELGMGAGPNLTIYGAEQGLRVTGIDANPEMAPYAMEAADRSGPGRDNLTLVQGDVQALPLADASMDAVVCTLVLCSVSSVSDVLREAQRVLRPGGKFIFIEHVAAPQDHPLLRFQQALFNPLQRLLADNCHLTRNTLQAIEGSGFANVTAERFEVEGAGLIAPHVAGTATCR